LQSRALHLQIFKPPNFLTQGLLSRDYSAVAYGMSLNHTNAVYSNIKMPQETWEICPASWAQQSQTLPQLVFDLASLTKPLCTAYSIFQKYGPTNIPKLVAKLLNHQSGLPAWGWHAMKTSNTETYFQQALQQTEKHNKTLYSDIGYHILGSYFARPPVVAQQFYTLEYQNMNTIYVPNRGFFTGAKPLVHDTNAALLHRQTNLCPVSYHAGAFGSVHTIATVLHDLATIHPVWIDKHPNIDAKQYYGGLESQGNGMFRHTGYTGTAFYTNPQGFAILLTNRTQQYLAQYSHWVAIHTKTTDHYKETNIFLGTQTQHNIAWTPCTWQNLLHTPVTESVAIQTCRPTPDIGLYRQAVQYALEHGT
jgi:hypothetical protein